MREIALAVRVENKNIIDFLQCELDDKLDFCKTIITNYCDNNFCYLLFACEEEFMKLCEDVIRNVIINYIETVYKVNYIKKIIKNPFQDSLEYNAYVKVLAIFDKSTDTNALKDIVLFNETFFVDSFLEFRLTPLKAHWSNIAHLNSENITFFSSSTFIDIIRFLINTMDNEVYKVKIVCNNNNYKVYNIKNKNDRVIKIADCSNSLDLVSKVLNVCPNYVDVYLSNTVENDAVNLLSSVFANRLKIFSKR